MRISKNTNGFLVGGNIPCHRVVNSNGSLGGFCGEVSGNKILEKKKLLENEGIIFEENNRIGKNPNGFLGYKKTECLFRIKNFKEKIFEF